MSPDALTFAAIAASVVGSAAGIAVVGVRTHAYWRRAAGAAPTLSRLDADRLARLETAIDAIAVEVERIGEGQRFLAHVRAESLDRRAPAARARGVD